LRLNGASGGWPRSLLRFRKNHEVFLNGKI
jgi:hypothetical protein